MGALFQWLFSRGIAGTGNRHGSQPDHGTAEGTQRRNQEKFLQSNSLLEERINHTRFLTLLNEILLAALETDDMTAMLKVLANRTGKLFNTENCFISFWDEKLRRPIPMASYGPRSAAFFDTVQKFENNERTLTAAILDQGHAFAFEDIRNTAQISENVAEKFKKGSVLGLPLTSGNRKLGTVILALKSIIASRKRK